MLGFFGSLCLFLSVDEQRTIFRCANENLRDIAEVAHFGGGDASASGILGSSYHMGWGWGKEELWMDKEQRRYETKWQMWRKLFMALVPLFDVGSSLEKK